MTNPMPDTRLAKLTAELSKSGGDAGTAAGCLALFERAGLTVTDPAGEEEAVLAALERAGYTPGLAKLVHNRFSHNNMPADERTAVPARGLDLAWYYAPQNLDRTQIIERLAERDARITRSLGETGMYLRPEDLLAIADLVEQIPNQPPRHTGEEAAVLAALERDEYPLCVAEIAERSGVLSYAVVGHLVRLTAAGLIRAVDEPERENRWTVCCKHDHTRQVSEAAVECLDCGLTRA